jgi:hypothetical protein
MAALSTLGAARFPGCSLITRDLKARGANRPDGLTALKFSEKCRHLAQPEFHFCDKAVFRPELALLSNADYTTV